MRTAPIAFAFSVCVLGCGPEDPPTPDTGTDATAADASDTGADGATEVGSETASETASEAVDETTSETVAEVGPSACGNPTPTGAAEFRVHDEGFVTTLGLQQYPHVAASQGGFTVVWLDTQSADTGIWAQWFDSAGDPTGAAERVSDSAGDVMKGPPRVAREFPDGVIGDAAALSVVVWEDGRADFLGDIYGQRHDDSNGAFLGGNFRVDDAPSGAQREATVSMWPSSPGFVVAWTDQRDGNEDIYVRRFGGDGAPLGASVRVNDDGGIQNQHSPDVARGPDGGFIVVWKDFRDTVRGVSEIWARRYDGTGLALGASFQVDADLSGAVTPRVDVTGDGSFVITWVGAAPDGRTVRARRYHADGSPDGDIVALSGAAKPTVAFPSVGILFDQIPKAGYIVTWDEPGAGVHARCVDAAGRAVGEDVVVSLPVGGEQARATLATVGVGNVNPPMNRTLVLWHDDRVGDLDIWAQELLGACNPSGVNRMASGRADGTANQGRAAIAAAPDGRAVVVWQDDRDVAAGLDLWGRRLDGNGGRVGADFVVASGVPGVTSDQRDADVAMAADGGFVVAYTDLAGAGGGDGDVMARRFSEVGAALGDPFAVASENGGAEGLAAIAVRADGTFAIAWGAGAVQPDAAVWVRRFGPDGGALGAALRVDGDGAASRHGPPALAFEADGGLVVTWSDARDGDPDVWLQRVTAEGVLAGVNVRVTASAEGVQILPSIAVSPSGEALVAWVDYADSAWGDIRARRWGAAGPLEASFQVNDVDDVANPFPDELPYGPVVAALPSVTGNGTGDASFVVTWTDYRAGKEDPGIRAQGVAAGVLAGVNFEVDQGPAGSAQVDPDVARDAASPLALTFVWTDDRAAADKGGISVWGRRLTCP